MKEKEEKCSRQTLLTVKWRHNFAEKERRRIMSNQNARNVIKEKRADIPTLICNEFTQSKGMKRAIDFRDGLTGPRNVEHYAKLHPSKSDMKLNQYPSVIQIWLTNSGNGKSTSVTANLSPSIPRLWLDICKQNIGMSVVPLYKKVYGGDTNELEESPIGILVKAMKANSRIGRALVYIIEDKIESLEYRVKNNIVQDTIDEYPYQINALKKASKVFRTKDVSPLYAIRFPRKVDYTFNDIRVQPHKEKNGYVPVRTINVVHASISDKYGGAEIDLPWKFEIKNFEAVKIKTKYGLVTYKKNTEKNMKSAQINLSEMQMYELMTRVTRFIELWEYANCVSVIRDGSQKRYELVQTYYDRQQQRTSQEQGMLSQHQQISQGIPFDSPYFEQSFTDQYVNLQEKR